MQAAEDLPRWRIVGFLSLLCLGVVIVCEWGGDGEGEVSEIGFVFGAVAVVILTCASSCSVLGALVSTSVRA